MLRTTFTLLVVMVQVTATIPSARAADGLAEGTTSEDGSGVPPSPKDLEYDLAIVAKSQGWSIDETRERTALRWHLARFSSESH